MKHQMLLQIVVDVLPDLVFTQYVCDCVSHTQLLLRAVVCAGSVS
jgi:hypothetical protein